MTERILHPSFIYSLLTSSPSFVEISALWGDVEVENDSLFDLVVQAAEKP